MMQGLQLGAPTTTGTSQTVTSQASTPTSPTAACSARANNAFADLSIGKVGGKSRGDGRCICTVFPSNLGVFEVK